MTEGFKQGPGDCLAERCLRSGSSHRGAESLGAKVGVRASPSGSFSLPSIFRRHVLLICRKIRVGFWGSRRPGSIPDVLITWIFFTVLLMRISLTVIAALLTLLVFNNDTIVIFFF